MPNRLANETSPYLLQHKHNPVDWHPWGPEALRRARDEDRPIMLSIGYAACHWCHVMAHESFEDPDTAEVMNALYVNIKVDREERPDLDGIYMQAVQTLTGSGGWPMTVFLTPDGRPFFGGTYFPKEARPGMPAFVEVLKAAADAYHSRRGEVVQSAGQIVARLKSPKAPARGEPMTASLLQQALQRLASGFDWDHGGFGGAPKFPQPMALEFLMRSYRRQPDARSLQMVELTLTRMARGGMYDQLGGGFHRYATDAHWLVPHFEKMLYDNALLSQTYLHAYQLTGNAFYRRIVEETCDYVLREMTHPDGGFYSTQDADSEGVEGKFFVWSPREVIEVLGEEDGRLFNAYFDVTEQGNFEGHSILNVPAEAQEVAAELGVSAERLGAVIEAARPKLYDARERRVHPGRDDKVLTSWNGMMLTSLAEAGAALSRRDYVDAATANAAFVLANLRQDGRLLRTWKDGRAKLLAYLEDYALLIDGLIALHGATFQRRWLDEARGLAGGMMDLFWDEAQGFFYDTGRDHEELVVRPRDIYDGATPCGGSAAAHALLRLAVVTGDADYQRKAAASLRSVAPFLPQQPAGLAHWLGALDFYLSKPVEVAIVGPPRDEATSALAAVTFGAYLPNKVVVGLDPEAGPEAAAPDLSGLLAARPMVDGRPTAYVCESYVCKQPTTDPATLREQLAV